MNNTRADWVMLGLVLSWPVLLAVGITLVASGQGIGYGFITYCITSSVGLYQMAVEFWQHGVHNDR